MRFLSATKPLPVLLNGSHNGIEINAAALGFDNELLDFLTEQLGSFSGTGRRQSCHCRTRSRVNLEDPFVDQLGDDLVCRIWIDLQFLAKGTYGRKGFPRTHLPRHNGFFRGVDDLVAEGSSGTKRYLKWDHCHDRITTAGTACQAELWTGWTGPAKSTPLSCVTHLCLN